MNTKNRRRKPGPRVRSAFNPKVGLLMPALPPSKHAGEHTASPVRALVERNLRGGR